MKCPYCKGKNLYLKRTWPIRGYGCRDCERKVKSLRDAGVDEKVVREFFKVIE